MRKNGEVPWLRPDGKTQVTVEYKKEGGALVPQRVHTILISTQHSPDVTNDKVGRPTQRPGLRFAGHSRRLIFSLPAYREAPVCCVLGNLPSGVRF